MKEERESSNTGGKRRDGEMEMEGEEEKKKGGRGKREKEGGKLRHEEA